MVAMLLMISTSKRCVVGFYFIIFRVRVEADLNFAVVCGARCCRLPAASSGPSACLACNETAFGLSFSRFIASLQGQGEERSIMWRPKLGNVSG